MSSETTVVYPTDPLTASEVDAIRDVIKDQSKLTPLFHPTDVSKTAVFLEVLLKEPNKKYVNEWEKNSQLPLKRKARVIVYNNVNNHTYVVILSLKEPGASGPIATIKSICPVCEKTYPNNNYDNYPVDDDFGGTQYYHYFSRSELIALVRNDTKLMKLLSYYNVTDEMLDPANSDKSDYIFPYAFYTFESFRQFATVDGHLPDVIPSDAKDHRYMPAGFFNPNIVPKDVLVAPANWGFVEGIFIIVDCNAKSIYKVVEDISKRPKSKLTPPIPLPVSDPYPVIYHPPMKPLATIMPEGVSFTVSDDDIHKVTWDNWEFHWSYQRSGLNLYNVYYTEQVVNQGQPEKRKILYKWGASDTVVVYNSTEPLIERHYVSGDSFNWPVLQRLQPLVKGRDVPGYAKLYPIVTMDAGGNSRVIEDAVAIYEQETDLIWRVNQGVIGLGWPNGESGYLKQVTGCRGRELVVRTIFSGFYYLFMYTYIFRQNGSCSAYCDLMGQTTNQWIEYHPDEELENEEYRGEVIAKQQVGLNHTHSVVWRMDFDIHHDHPEGGGNSINEHNSYRVYDKRINPAGQVINHEETLLERETARKQSINRNRTWAVYNPHSKNRLGHPRGYEIWSDGPNGNAPSLALDSSQAHRHFGYLKNHLFVTKYHEDEQYAVGEFPVLSDKLTGLEKYIEDEESVVDTDIVVWFNRMFSHTPSTEDYPFISTHRVGVDLEPENFFGMNPICSLEQKTTLLPDGAIGEPVLFSFDQ
jgi:primary-amine oxidase